MATLKEIASKLDKLTDIVIEQGKSITCLQTKWSGLRWVLGGLFFPVIVAMVLFMVL